LGIAAGHFWVIVALVPNPVHTEENIFMPNPVHGGDNPNLRDGLLRFEFNGTIYLLKLSVWLASRLAMNQ
jgi:hypothetical protein